MFVYKYGPVNNLSAGIVGMNVSTLCDLMGTGSNNTTVLVDKDAKVLINPDFASAKRNIQRICLE